MTKVEGRKRMYRESPIISVILAVYNLELYLERAIQSFIDCDAETFSELIIVDDGSTDNTSVILREFKEFNSIKIFKKSHHGLASSRNYGIEQAKGDYILFLDGDDAFDCKALYKLREVIQNNLYCELVYFNWQEVNGNRVISVEKQEAMHTIAVWNKCYKKSFLIRNNLYFPESCLFEDVGYSIKSFMMAEEVIYLDGEPIYYYHVRDDSESHRLIPSEERLSVIAALKDTESSLSHIDIKKEYAEMVGKYIYECWWFHLRCLILNIDENTERVIESFMLYVEESAILKHTISVKKNSGLKRCLFHYLISHFRVSNNVLQKLCMSLV